MTSLELEKIIEDLTEDLDETAIFTCDSSEHLKYLQIKNGKFITELNTKLEVIEKLSLENFNDENSMNKFNYQIELIESKILTKEKIINKLKSEIKLAEKTYWKKVKREEKKRELEEKEREEIESREELEREEQEKEEMIRERSEI